jgi:hypothetical protein
VGFGFFEGLIEDEIAKLGQTETTKDHLLIRDQHPSIGDEILGIMRVKT